MRWLPAARYTWRSRPAFAVAAVALVGPAFVLFVGKDTDAPIRLRVVGLALAVLVALGWEDRAAPLAAATPVGLPAVQRGRLLLLVLAASGALALTCVAATQRAPDVGVWSAAVEIGAVAALLTAIVGALARERLGESLSAYPVPLLLVLLVLAFRVPERWTLVASPGSPAWGDVHRRWSGLLVIGLLALVVVGRDPASRTLLNRGRRTA
ncbi:MAG: hypothetical protein JJD92_06420 [Frankiaceae bacterium]|nr:hypothetical protein [Frankiaceae bacterium]